MGDLGWLSLAPTVTPTEVTLSLHRASESPGDLVEMQTFGPMVQKICWRGPRIYIPNKSPGDADAALQGPHFEGGEGSHV